MKQYALPELIALGGLLDLTGANGSSTRTDYFYAENGIVIEPETGLEQTGTGSLDCILYDTATKTCSGFGFGLGFGLRLPTIGR